MDIIEVITTDHADALAKIRELDRLAADDARTSDAMRLAVRIAVAIKVHSKAEEKVLYEAMRTAPTPLPELALEGPHAHRAIDVTLDKLVLHRPGPELRAILHVVSGLF